MKTQDPGDSEIKAQNTISLSHKNSIFMFCSSVYHIINIRYGGSLDRRRQCVCWLWKMKGGWPVSSSGA